MKTSFGFIILQCAVLAAFESARADYTFTTIDYPSVSYSATFGISNAGHLVGEYTDKHGTYHGYLLYNDVFTSFDYPVSVGTSGLAVNSNGNVAGVFGEPGFYVYTQAFRRVGNNFTELEPVPGSTYTQAGGINDSGHTVGSYYVNGVDRGFLFDGTTYTTGLNKPGALHTIPLGINNGDWIVGDYAELGSRHGFLLVGGDYTTIDYPGMSFNFANGINDAGQIVGFYSNSESGPYHGFIYANGVYTTIEPPGSNSTQLRGINNSGQLSGFYTDTSGVTHGFLATPPEANPDFNGNGIVDAADYVVWRKRDGNIDDYDFWRFNFGQPVNNGAAAVSSAVPEPDALLLATLGICHAIYVASARARRR